MKQDWIGSLALHLRQKTHHLQKSSPLVKNGLTNYKENSYQYLDPIQKLVIF